MKRFVAGVTLLELMVVVAIVAILAAIAIPNYRSYVLRTNRVDATAALLRLASAQEKFYLQTNTYAAEAQRVANPPNGLGIAATEHGWYTLSIEAPAVGDYTTGYVARATVVGGSVQDADAACRSFTIAENGARDAFDSANASNRVTCWR